MQGRPPAGRSAPIAWKNTLAEGARDDRLVSPTGPTSRRGARHAPSRWARLPLRVLTLRAALAGVRAAGIAFKHLEQRPAAWRSAAHLHGCWQTTAASRLGTGACPRAPPSACNLTTSFMVSASAALRCRWRTRRSSDHRSRLRRSGGADAVRGGPWGVPNGAVALGVVGAADGERCVRLCGCMWQTDPIMRLPASTV